MSRIVSRTLRWDPPAATDVLQYQVFADLDIDEPAWLAEIDAGNVPPIATVTDPSWPINLPGEGDWSFAVTAEDETGNVSDPHQSPAWIEVPLDLTPPDPPTNGVIE